MASRVSPLSPGGPRHLSPLLELCLDLDEGDRDWPGGLSSPLRSLSNEADWWLIFLPIWIGSACCLLLLLLSWCASCQSAEPSDSFLLKRARYIKLCLSERVVRIDRNPSILTEAFKEIDRISLFEVLPEITTTIPGLVFLVLSFYTECQRSSPSHDVLQVSPLSLLGDVSKRRRLSRRRDRLT